MNVVILHNFGYARDKARNISERCVREVYKILYLCDRNTYYHTYFYSSHKWQPLPPQKNVYKLIFSNGTMNGKGRTTDFPKKSPCYYHGHHPHLSRGIPGCVSPTGSHSAQHGTRQIWWDSLHSQDIGSMGRPVYMQLVPRCLPSPFWPGC